MQDKYYFEDDPLWYKDAVIYQLHVKTFADGNGDGIGDFKGLTARLDYLENLGVNTIWLLPFYPSPLRDDGYDIADYMDINPSYGTIRDFKVFLDEAHKRGLRVITELVVNHTSDQHAWFQKARRAKKGSVARDFYMWSDTPEKYADARIIFKDFETSNWAWDPVAKAYYWHRFYSHQPDLNYDSPHVQKAIFKIADYWFGMGVDGVRLDAIPYLYAREGTNCENLPQTYEFLEKLRAHIDANFKNKMVLAEANQWPEDAAAYFGDGQQCNMNFHFPLMPRMYMALQMEDRFPIIDIMEQTPPIPDNCQWAIFLRNHDELTLEMVTDEERDYMYRVYASNPKARINLGIRRRLAPLLGNSRRKIELMNSLLFSMPGSPIIYYGDEIGMGDNYYLGDRNGVRTPMQWSSDKNAGFSRANPQELYLPIIIEPEYHYESVNVENQEKNASSLLWWMRRLAASRKRFKAFSRGTIEFILTDNSKVLSFVRKYGDEIILVVVNLSNTPQAVELNLADYAGFIPEEISSKNNFPAIKESPYLLTPGPYDFYWFALKKEAENIKTDTEGVFPEIYLKLGWANLPDYIKEEILEDEILPVYLQRCSWFGRKNKKIQRVRIIENILLTEEPQINLLLFEVSYNDQQPDIYLLPYSHCSSNSAATAGLPKEAMLALLDHNNNHEFLYDSLFANDTRQAILNTLVSRKVIRGKAGELSLAVDNMIRDLAVKGKQLANSQVWSNENGSTVLNYDSTLFMKVYRRLEPGNNPDMEVISFLNERHYDSVPEITGNIVYKGEINGKMTLAMLQKYIHNEGNAWDYTQEALKQYYRRLTEKPEQYKVSKLNFSELRLPLAKTGARIQDLTGSYYLELMDKLGKSTAELHKTLAAETTNPDFAPEAFSMLYQRSVYQSTRSKIKQSVLSLKKMPGKFSGDQKAIVTNIINSENNLIDKLKLILTEKLPAMKIRTHGHYNLHKLLYTGKEFITIDFAGDSNRALSERKLKRSPLRDVAGIIRSLYYAAFVALAEFKTSVPEGNAPAEEWALAWFYHSSAVFLDSYLEAVQGQNFIPENKADYELLLKIFIIDKFFSALEKELNEGVEVNDITLKGINFITANYLN